MRIPEEFAETVWSSIICTDVPGLRALIRDERRDTDLAKHRCNVTHGGGTVLHMAAACATSTQAAKVLDLIVKSRADIERVNDLQRTLLMVCRQRNPFRLLVEMGADIRHRDIHGRTCWHLATAETLDWLAKENPNIE